MLIRAPQQIIDSLYSTANNTATYLCPQYQPATLNQGPLNLPWLCPPESQNTLSSMAHFLAAETHVLSL